MILIFIDISGEMLLTGRVGGGGEAYSDMSLFHNLKLKRRKVDSRGSSDGELYSLHTFHFKNVMLAVGCCAGPGKLGGSVVMEVWL